MAWETRRKGAYYYRKTRQGRRVVSQYIGAGLLGDLLAAEDAQAAAEDAAARAAWQQERAAIEEADPLLDELAARLASLTRAVLLASGCHTHHGTWRRTRGKTKTPAGGPGPSARPLDL